MKSLLSIALTLGLLSLVSSCNSDAVKDTTTDVAALDTVKVETPEVVNYLFPATLGSDWKIGDPQKIVKVQELYKIMLADSNYESTLSYYADSITNISFDNRKIKVGSPQFLEIVKKFMESEQSA